MHTHKEHRALATMLRALANERRIHLLLLLRRQRLSEIAMARAERIRPSSVSKHLHRLMRVGLVEGERCRNTVSFSLTRRARSNKTLWCMIDSGILQ